MYEQQKSAVAYGGGLQAAGQIAGQSYDGLVKPPQPTVFARCAGKLEAQVAHINGLVDRASRVADRLGGSVPQPVADKAAGMNGSHIAAQMEISMELLDGIIRRFEGTLERLESL
jgi:hypothetical protein